MVKNYYIYDIKEALRQYSDDSDITVAYISFLIDDARALLLRQKYKGIGQPIPNIVKQRLHLTLELTDENEFVANDKILRTTNSLPRLIESGEYLRELEVDGGSYKDLKFIYVPSKRFVYSGHNRMLPNTIYTTIGQDYKLYFNSYSLKHRAIESVRVYGTFENPKDAWEASADYDNSKTFEEDVTYPIDLDMWVAMKDVIIKQLVRSMEIPEDKNNNASEV